MNNKKLTINLFKVFSLMLIFIISTSIVVYANDKKVKINELHSTVNILKDGLLKVEETLIMDFSGKFNGAFKDISTKGTNGIKDLKVFLIEDGAEKEFKYSEKAKNGDSFLYEIEEENKNLFRIKLYIPSRNVKKKIKLSYTLSDVTTLYNDVGELYYNFWDKGYKSEIDSFNGVIALPKEVSEKDINAFFDTGDGFPKAKIENNKIIFEATDIKKDMYLTGRVLFPKDILISSAKTEDKDGLAEILQKEERKRLGYEKKEETNKKIKKGVDFLVYIFSIIGLTLIIFYMKITKRIIKTENLSEFPEKCSPAILSRFYNGTVTTKEFITTLLDLNRRGFIELEDNTVGKNEDYKIIVLDKPYEKLLAHEQYLIDWLIDISNYNNEITMKGIEGIAKDKEKGINFTISYHKWIKKVNDLVKDNNYFDKSNRKYGVLYITLSVIAFIISIISLINGNIIAILSLIISIIIFALGIGLIIRLSDYGYSEKMKWKKVKTNFEGKDLGSMAMMYPLDEYLPYMITLNVSRKRLEEFRKFALTSSIYATNMWLINYLNFDNFTTTNSFIYYGAYGAFSSTVGYDGGSSTGGGGGCSGGGAGGF
ncbi:hypothetical protein U732_629 [Clostridium argentinense CDC 2741]|uniref:DUF2207 domain-containing protein n=1 Tax=Clostridium argentinense CDC 2741 TaxID=1418104 RepID=A0A0C1UB94_9CLOT|nr:DUF2207 domain-containing protein [Clostridium argentinense]ARC84108.1 hypothetical protein RSJ17_05945 [Clostridium argentinense]KIE44840.1 hypothetical protein U732_629 [Clostridium argentinense CDC 2741]NFF39287.1 DUF2207 domain-containing protein [Clostridium argentinense]NFP51470.1 DUF2207 domain-containing protein [Clostridium argentinense]NFP74343.1 DUF2207 domain-containing protein [Clostridium argentinense]